MERLILVRERDLALLIKGPLVRETMVEYQLANARVEQAVNSPEIQLEYVATILDQYNQDHKNHRVDGNRWIGAARAVLSVPE